MRRPDVFTLDYSHPLAQGLVFGGWGGDHSFLGVRDSSKFKRDSLPIWAGYPLSAFQHSDELQRQCVNGEISGAAPIPAGSIAIQLYYISVHDGKIRSRLEL